MPSSQNISTSRADQRQEDIAARTTLSCKSNNSNLHRFRGAVWPNMLQRVDEPAPADSVSAGGDGPGLRRIGRELRKVVSRLRHLSELIEVVTVPHKIDRAGAVGARWYRTSADIEQSFELQTLLRVLHVPLHTLAEHVTRSHASIRT